MGMVAKVTAVHVADASLSVLVETGAPRAPQGKAHLSIIQGETTFGASLSAADARRIGKALIHHAMRLDLAAGR